MSENDYSFIPKFELGGICDSPGASECLSAEEVMIALGRHVVGDWGDVRTHGWNANCTAVAAQSGEIVSAYWTMCGERFLVVTDLTLRQTLLVLSKEAPKYMERVGHNRSNRL